MSKQKVALFSGIGKTGGRLMAEALKRKHYVTAIVYDVTKVPVKHPNLDVIYGHMMNKEEVSKHVKNHNIIIGVHEPMAAYPYEHVKAVRSVVEGAKKAEVNRLILMAHPIYRPVENTLEFYASWKIMFQAQQEALKFLQNQVSLDWAYIHSPQLEPEAQTGKLVMGSALRLTTAEGETKLPVNTYASALFDEAEKSIQPKWKEPVLHI